MAETDPLYLALYNAQTNDDLYRLMYSQAGAITRAANLLRKAFPSWMDASEQHWQRYKRFVERWVRDELTEADWQHLWRWLGTDAQTVFQHVIPPPEAPSWSLAGWLITAMQTNPHEPFTEAYRQIAEHMLRERFGLTLRPRFCNGCGRLFEPDRVTQHYCRPRCRFRVHQRELRARRKHETRIRDASSSPKATRGGDGPPSPRH